MPHELPPPRRLPRLWTQAFVLLCAFYFLTFFAGYQLFPIVPLHLRDLGANLAESGRFMATFTLGSALGCLFTGPLGDRVGQRRMLRWASLAMVAFFLLYAFVPKSLRWAFYVLAPLNGLVWSGLRTAAMAKAGSLLSPEHRAEGMSFFGMASPAGIAVGPLMGLALWPFLGFRWMLLALGAIFLGLHLMVRRLPGEAPEEQRRGAGFQLPERAVLLPVLILFLVGVSYGPMPPYSAQEAKLLHMAWSSAFLTSLALGMAVMRMLLGMTGMGKRPIRLLPPMIVLAAAGLALLALLPGGLVRHILSGALYGAGFSMVHTLLFMHLINRVAADRRGSAVGAMYFSYDVGQAAGAFSLGWAMERTGHVFGQAVGYRWGWGIGALCLLACLWISRSILAPRRREEEPGLVASPS